MNKATAIVELLEGTHKILSVPGVWVNHHPRSGHCHCLLTALSKARESVGYEDNLLDGAIALLVEVIGSKSIAGWNDAPERTLPEVLEAVAKAAARARARLQ